MDLDKILKLDFSDLLAGSGDEIAEQVAKDWDALMRMFSYLIEFFASLFV